MHPDCEGVFGAMLCICPLLKALSCPALVLVASGCPIFAISEATLNFVEVTAGTARLAAATPLRTFAAYPMAAPAVVLDPEWQFRQSWSPAPRSTQSAPGAL